MSKKTAILLGSCTLFAITLVMGLFAATHKIVHEGSGFLREYGNRIATRSKELDIEYNTWYVAGMTDTNIYLGNIAAPFNLLIINHALTDSQHVKIHIKGINRASVYRSATVKIDPPYFYLADGIKPGLYRGKLGEWKAEPFPYDTGAYFNRLVPISKTSFAIRTNSANSYENILGKVQLDSPHIQLKEGLLQKQVDGIFCTDGWLLFNERLNRLIYTYYYRNEFIVYDSNLNLDYRGHSIDTFRHAKIKVGHISSDRINKLIDKRIVNIRSATSGNYLYIRSNVLAKNDSKDRLSTAAIFDVYDLKNRTYSFSFSILNYDYSRDNLPIRDFMIFDNKVLIGLFDHYLVKYDLHQENF